MSKPAARSFVVPSRFAPGFCCVGAEFELAPALAEMNGSAWLGATGNGTQVDVACVSCLGEAADLISQFERPGDVTVRGEPTAIDTAIVSGWIADAVGAHQDPVDWVEAVELRSGQAARLPADFALRRRPSDRTFGPVGALSSGVAAGPDFRAATLRAILELCERDALALWWQCGRPARSFAEGHPSAAAGTALLDQLRQGGTGRATRLLDISTDLGIPTVAAVSTDLDGRGLACGAAARLDPAEAARAALLELCQMELSAPLAAAKRAERGEAALNDADRRHLRRAALAASECRALAADALSDLPGKPVMFNLEALVERLHEHGIAVYRLDLTRADLGVPVARAIAPELQPFATMARTRHADRARSESGCAGTEDLPLF